MTGEKNQQTTILHELMRGLRGLTQDKILKLLNYRERTLERINNDLFKNKTFHKYTIRKLTVLLYFIIIIIEYIYNLHCELQKGMTAIKNSEEITQAYSNDVFSEHVILEKTSNYHILLSIVKHFTSFPSKPNEFADEFLQILLWVE